MTNGGRTATCKRSMTKKCQERDFLSVGKRCGWFRTSAGSVCCAARCCFFQNFQHSCPADATMCHEAKEPRFSIIAVSGVTDCKNVGTANFTATRSTKLSNVHMREIATSQHTFLSRIANPLTSPHPSWRSRAYLFRWIALSFHSVSVWSQ